MDILRSPDLAPRYRDLLEQHLIHRRTHEELVDREMARPENAGKPRARVRNSCVDQPLSRAWKRVAVLLARRANKRSN